MSGKRKTVVTDKAVALYHVVYKEEGFEVAARHLFEMVRSAQQQWPGKRRVLYLDIEGHRNTAGGFDGDMLELLQHYVMGFLGRHLSELHTPLYDGEPSAPQDNNVPDDLQLQAPTS